MHARMVVTLGLALAALPAVALGGDEPPVDVGVTLRASSDAVTVGEFAAFVLDVRNAADRRAKDVAARVRVEGADARVVEAPRCEVERRTVSCEWNRLAGGTSERVRVVVRAEAAGRLTATAEVESDDLDPNAANDRDVAGTDVGAASAPGPAPQPGPQPGPAPGPVPLPDAGPTPAGPDEPSAPDPRPGEPVALDPGIQFDLPAAPAAPEAPAEPPAPRSLPLALLLPVPVVRLAGRITRAGARITLLTVRTPADVRITVTCTGRTCPFERVRRTVAARRHRAVTVRIRAAERTYRAGTRRTVAVQRRGALGKHTRFEIRRGRSPRRLYACIAPSASRPRPCPSS